MSTFRKPYLCKKCHSANVSFDENKRAASGKLIPLEVEAKQLHDCHISSPFPCKWCNKSIYLDKNIVLNNGKRIPLDIETEEPHFYLNKPKPPNRELKFFRNGGV